jgi:peptidoglycan/LPS O-acetylase OafA/YrhL
VSCTAPGRIRLAGLDGLRALAAVSVLSYHVALFSRFAFAGPFASVLWELKGGVTVFFVISGTVLYLPYARAIRDGSRLPDWRDYAGRRVVRIVPAYWTCLTFFTLGPFAAGVLGPNLWRYYGLSQIYSSRTVVGGLGVAWSLCVEVTFYAVLPLFARAAASLVHWAGPRTGLRAQVGLIALAGLSSIILRAALAGSATAPIQNHGLTLTVALPGFLDWFAVGMGLAVLAAEWEAGRQSPRMLVRLADRPAWCAALGLVAFGVGIPYQGGDMFLPWYGLATHLALGAGSGFLVLAAIRTGRDRGRGSRVRVLGSAWLAWMGTISYGIYLWQLVVLELISRRSLARTVAGASLLWLAVLGGAVVLGAMSWYLLERPLQRAVRDRQRGAKGAISGGRTPDLDVGVHSVTDPLNPSGVAVDHLA